MYQQELKIPKDRVGVLIGVKGEVKGQIEGKFGVKIDVDSKMGDVIISGEDSVNVYSAKNIVKAIGRGFAPEVAMQLEREDYMFDLIDITDYVGKSKKGMERLKGRMIGSEGKARKMIEMITETRISVYGKTVGIIGEIEGATIARRAVDMLLSGSPHGNVYKWLENQKRELKKRMFEGHGI